MLVSDGTDDLNPLISILKKEYRVAYFDSAGKDFAGNKEQTGGFSAAVICAADAASDDYALFKWVKTDSMIASIPMLIYCPNEDYIPYANGCLERGAVDIIMPPLYDEVILHRIRNSIRLKDSATFYEIEKMLKELPSNIFLKDEKGRYVFATHYWNHLETDGDPDWTIRGKTDLEIRKDKDNARKAMEADRKIIETGIGTSYIIEENVDGNQEFLELIKEPVRDDDGNVTGIIALINNVTETEQLRRRLEHSALRDELTGIRNKTAYGNEIGLIEKRMDSDEVPEFGIAMVDMNFLKRINDTYGHEQGNVALRKLCRTICMIFKHSPVFRIGGDEFVVIVEGCDLKEGDTRVRELRNELEKIQEDDRLDPWEKPSASIGLAVYDPSLDKSVSDVFERADKLMYENKRAMKATRRD